MTHKIYTFLSCKKWIFRSWIRSWEFKVLCLESQSLRLWKAKWKVVGLPKSKFVLNQWKKISNNFQCLHYKQLWNIFPYLYVCCIFSAYNYLDYYVDGQYDSFTGKWMTSSGTEIQHSYNMWSSNPAYFSGDQPCIRMKKDTQYKINSHQCSTLYGVICERPWPRL